MTSPDNGSQQPADTSSRPPLPTNSPRFAQGADWIEAYRRGRPLTWTDAWTVVKIKLATSWSNALRARKTLGLCLGGIHLFLRCREKDVEKTRPPPSRLTSSALILLGTVGGMAAHEWVTVFGDLQHWQIDGSVWKVIATRLCTWSPFSVTDHASSECLPSASAPTPASRLTRSRSPTGASRIAPDSSSSPGRAGARASHTA
ncbi:hypothetical protein A1Q2_00272 [Trichosporon asahii var. asahii CBS 8904]|uniref:Uncharacterized protein n=1 Tax=Trichosporon asahii var. asahii (strain CBS 8904) TaxID=1220162 RepID=K1VY38_TRIAC|nr:hypothetical protein A1Q2_00272 [Trichosporon asahii var. asahii CBS 8904]